MSYGSVSEPTAMTPKTQPQQVEEEERDRFDEGKETVCMKHVLAFLEAGLQYTYKSTFT